VTTLSLDREALTLSPKKDLVRFVGAAAPRVGVPAEPTPVEAPPPPAGSTGARPRTIPDVASGVIKALDSALTVPVSVLVAVGLLRPARWRRKRARRPRLLLAGCAVVLIALLARLQAGWGYSGGRHALAASVLLLAFAGEGLMTCAALLSRVTSRRRFALFFAALLAIPLGTKAVLRPEGESGVGARRLGEALAAASEEDRAVHIASSVEPLVAWYAHRGLQERGGAHDLPLWGRFLRPLEAGAPLGEVADALADELRERADWVVLDVEPPLRGAAPTAERRLAEACWARPPSAPARTSWRSRSCADYLRPASSRFWMARIVRMTSSTVSTSPPPSLTNRS
jgi:hypothetical protein